MAVSATVSTVTEPVTIVKRTVPSRSCHAPGLLQERVVGELPVIVPEQIGVREELPSNISYESRSPLWSVLPFTVKLNMPCGKVVNALVFPTNGSELNGYVQLSPGLRTSCA